MPRHVDPHLGCDGFSDYEPFELTEAEAARLTDILDSSLGGDGRELLRRDIEEIGNMWRRWHQRGAEAFSRVEARKALEVVAGLPRLDQEALSQLNERAYEALVDQIGLMPGIYQFTGGTTVCEALMEERIPGHILRRAISNAVTALKSQKGRDRQATISICVVELCGVYQEYSGRAVTHSAKSSDRHYVRGMRSSAGRFLTACFDVFEGVDPEDLWTNAKQDRLHQQVSEALRGVVKARRAGRPGLIAPSPDAKR